MHSAGHKNSLTSYSVCTMETPVPCGPCFQSSLSKFVRSSARHAYSGLFHSFGQKVRNRGRPRNIPEKCVCPTSPARTNSAREFREGAATNDTRLTFACPDNAGHRIRTPQERHTLGKLGLDSWAQNSPRGKIPVSAGTTAATPKFSGNKGRHWARRKKSNLGSRLFSGGFWTAVWKIKKTRFGAVAGRPPDPRGFLSAWFAVEWALAFFYVSMVCREMDPRVLTAGRRNRPDARRPKNLSMST